MNTAPKGHDNPPSPTAPSFWSPLRVRIAAGAAVVAVGLATFLGPVAAAELTGEEPAAPTEASASSTTTSTTPTSEARPASDESGSEPEWSDQELAYFEAVEAQRVEAFLRAASEANRRREAEAAEAARRAAEEQAAQERAEQDRLAQEEAARQQAAAPAVSNGSVWDSLAACESGGNWGINTGNGYYGGLQFSLGTWQALGGSGMPHQNSREAQIAVAQRVLDAQGWGAWPSCSRKLGLR